MSITHQWLQSMSFRELLYEELRYRQRRIHPDYIESVCDQRITKIQAEINRRIRKG